MRLACRYYAYIRRSLKELVIFVTFPARTDSPPPPRPCQSPYLECTYTVRIACELHTELARTAPSVDLVTQSSLRHKTYRQCCKYRLLVTNERAARMCALAPIRHRLLNEHQYKVVPFAYGDCLAAFRCLGKYQLTMTATPYTESTISSLM